MRAIGLFRLSYVTICFGLGIFLNSCERKDKIQFPFGYDPEFDYLAVLRSSPAYAYEPTNDYPELTYQDHADEKLVELKNRYNLDSVAGTGDELTRILNLFNWVHDKISHDGGNSTPDPENSLSILDYCRQSGKGVNCVYMAIVFNEACLAMGIKSRVIHGNAKKFIFNGEWHTFNAVYSSTLDKWIFLDPMKRAYFMDENNNLLSIAEIRQFLIEGKPLLINPEADYNGLSFDKDEYLHYLTKNFYRFSCSVESKFNNYGIFHLTGVTRDYVHLDPGGEPQDGLGLATNCFTSKIISGQALNE